MACKKLAILASMLGVTSLGCAWRIADSEYLIGPALFRYNAPPEGEAYVIETWHFPFALEGGSQWGVSAGFKRRVAAWPVDVSGASSPGNGQPELRFRKPLSPFGPPEPGKWNLNLLLLSGKGVKRPEFLAHRRIGVSISAGAEATAISAGFSRVTRVRPLKERLYVLSYRSDKPSETIYRTWEGSGNEDPPMEVLMKGVERWGKLYRNVSDKP